MSELSEFISDGFAALLDLAGETITFRGAEIVADVSEIGARPEFVMGGESARKSCTILLAIPSPDFTPDMRKNERITARGGELEIVGITKDETTYRLDCAEVFRK